MAGFCTKCGSPLSSSTGFCSACGAPIGVAAAPVQEAAPQPVAAPAAAVYAPPVAGGYPPAAGYPTEPAKSSSALKIVLIIIAVVVGIGLLAAAGIGYTAYKVAHSVVLNNKGDGGTVTVPGLGTVTAGAATPTDAQLGVPAYPGAVTEKGGAQVNMGPLSETVAHYATSDSMSQVVDFYKSKMGDNAISIETGNGTTLTSGSTDTDRITVTVAPGDGDDAGKTTIVVMHMKKAQ